MTVRVMQIMGGESMIYSIDGASGGQIHYYF